MERHPPRAIRGIYQAPVPLGPPFLGFAVGVNDGIVGRPLPWAIDVAAASRKHHVACRRSGRSTLGNVQVVITVVEQQLRCFEAIALYLPLLRDGPRVKHFARLCRYGQSVCRQFRHRTTRQSVKRGDLREWLRELGRFHADLKMTGLLHGPRGVFAVITKISPLHG